MTQEALLIEIGTEELPPNSLKKLAQAFQQNVADSLTKININFENISWYATPKRLALSFSAIDIKQPDQIVEKRGPAVSAAFDSEGNPTKAAIGWAKGNGIEVSEAERLVTDKGEWLLLKKHQEGKALQALLGDVIEQSLQKLPIPKPMKWGAGNQEFVRPIHNITIVLGSQTVQCNIKNMDSSNLVRGHRYHSPDFYELDHASNYLESLQKRFVQADYEARKAAIQEGLIKAANKLNATVQIEEDLLEEVTALVEWPVVLSASFEEHFLSVPKEALIYTMKGDQRYFPLLSESGDLLPKFLFVSNIESKSPDKVISGNEKVIRPRLADAKFFYESDLKTPFKDLSSKLDSVVFQKQLGTILERTQRIAELAKAIASKLGANTEEAYTAGLLSKNDLVTNMVLEFPAMQGIMGKYYAKAAGYSDDVANAIYEQYLPAFSGDSLPQTKVGSCVALAEKLDTLVGIFATGQIPKGDKDPFALRRAAIGILRICNENQFDIELDWLINQSTKLVQSKFDATLEQSNVVAFLFNRLKAIYLDMGYDNGVIQSVLSTESNVVSDFDLRVQAIAKFTEHSSATTLIEANKRVANFLKKSADTDVDVKSLSISPDYFESEYEKSLYNAINAVEKTVNELLAKQSYADALNELATLKQVIDDFFANVMVNSDNPQIKLNRLAMLYRLRALFLNIADVSLLS